MPRVIGLIILKARTRNSLAWRSGYPLKQDYA